ncbi:hypothetical protein L873DRAFT_1799276 [Choiromyces venosus 120613-1]|uniref:Uncharacterized protein n=1 Tax=Choiromyces venosus 120613-1 TaxID=1336337 RepID=A0A3N4K4Z8_9PEZI|nr:hypothetical protein L873DRAFT_1799276 [Choiromyces venosus 120613-1]
MPRFESPVSSNALTSHSCSHSKSMLLESYVLEASEPPQPTATTTGTASRDHTPTAGTTTTTHFLIHMHLSPNTTPNYPSHQTIHYSHTPLGVRLYLHHSSYSTASSSSMITLPSTRATNLQDLHRSLLHSQHLNGLLFQEQQQQQRQKRRRPLADIPIGDFLPPAPYIPSEAEAEDLDVKTVAQQGGYAVCRFFNTREEEEANIVYARSVGIGRGRRGREG